MKIKKSRTILSDSNKKNINSVKKSRFTTPIAVIGFSFRFPGDLNNETDLWDALKQKRDLITQIPANRWAVDELQHDKRSEPGRSVTFSAGVLSHIDEFDASFFGISPREAAVLDPQQRMLLELAWESMENAGVLPSSLAGTDCAVYIGISGFDYCLRALDDLSAISPHSMTGNTLSIAANRLSYIFDFRGPSLAVDTACSSSLVALHQACNGLRNGEISTALVGGVNLLLHPHPFIGFTKASMLSSQGRCKPFDAAGDGYVRSEGGAVMLLKPLQDALADGNDVHAVILGSGVNADGSRKTGITIPSSEGQAELMHEVLIRSGLAPQDVDFIEAHGTGTVVGDPIEASAIGAIYGQQRTKPLPISSIKANMGHLEPVSGMAGLIKAILAFKHHALPPMPHLRTPNPNIDFQALNLKLVKNYQSLSRHKDQPLVAGINSFGFGGINAHVLLEEFISPTEPVVQMAEKQLPPLFLSARTDAALRAMAQRYAVLLENKSPEEFYDIAHAAAYQRERMEKRLTLCANSVAEHVEILQHYAKDNIPDAIIIEDQLPQNNGLAFIYSGNGAQWTGMGCRLLEESPRFVEILAEINSFMQVRTGFSLVETLQDVTCETCDLSDTTVAQPLLFAIQVAVTLLLREQGIEPTAVAGHSVGEVAAAWAAGALDLEQAVQVICVRSQAQGLTRGKGRMAAVGMSTATIQQTMLELGVSGVEIAGINGPNNVTLSGELQDLLRIQKVLEPQGIFFRLLDLDYAFHSPHMDTIADNINSDLVDLVPVHNEAVVFVSTVTGDVLSGAALNANYWWRNVREPVQFSNAVTKLLALGCNTLVEIGPHAILQRYINECMTAADIQGRVLPTLRRNDDGVQRVMETALRAHLLADTPQLEIFFPHPGRSVRLPNYPWQREHHWYKQTSESQHIIERHRVHPLLGWRLLDTDITWENTIDPIVLPWLADHKVGEAIVYPGAGFAEMALAAAREWLDGEHCVVEQLNIIAPMVFDEHHAKTIRFVLATHDGRFQIKSRQRLSQDEWILHAVGRVLAATDHIPASNIDLPTTKAKWIRRTAHYQLTAKLGLNYGPIFQGLREARVWEDRLEVRLSSPKTLSLDDYLLHPAVLDVCFQSLVDFFSEPIKAGQGVTLLPVKIGKIDFCGTGKVDRLRAKLRQQSTRSVLADFELFNDVGDLVACATGCRFRAAHIMHTNQSVVTNWEISSWLQPHPRNGLTTETPAIATIAQQIQTQWATVEEERHTWFTETLPLTEALTLSFAYVAWQQLDSQSLSHVLTTPSGRWLANLLSQEGLLRQKGDQYELVADENLPTPETLWRMLLHNYPTYLPYLTQLGRVGKQLPALLRGEVEGDNLLNELHHSPIAEALYHDDPVYLGLRLALESTLRHLARNWPASRRLRVLEITSGFSELPKTLIDLLPEDRFDYVLALPNEAMQTRLLTEYQEHANVVVSTLEFANWQLLTEQVVPSAFDVVILRHSLHRCPDVMVAFTQIRHWLAANGILLLAERHPDWSANFIEGIDPNWWHEAEDSDIPLSPLLSPQAWQHALQDAGFVEVEIVSEASSAELAEGAYLLLAKQPVRIMTDAKQAASNAASWLLVTDQASARLANSLGNQLVSQGQQIVLANQISAEQRKGADHIVYMLGWHDHPDMAADTLSKLLKDVHQLATQTEKKQKLWLITHGGTAVSKQSIGATSNPAQFALWGFGRVVMNEYPHLDCTLLDLACSPAMSDLPVRLENELLHPDGSNEIVLFETARHHLVMQEKAELLTTQHFDRENKRFRLDFHVPGQLRNLVWRADNKAQLGDSEIEICTQATGLNFRDVMYLMGLLPDEAVENGFAGASLGLEFAGIVNRVGAQVRDLQPGDAVMGFGASCFSSHIVTRADAVTRIPANWSFEAAATIPTVFFTAYYALHQLANLQPGERVLIHGAAGGVGIAAIQLARHLGAEIYATAGTDEKRDFVRLLGADHVFDSRSLTFADDIFAVTAGEGIDVVLNSLAGEAMRRSISVLKPFGRFLELGKRDFFENTSVGLYPFKNNISYFAIDADQLLIARPQLAARLFREVMTLFHERTLAPLPYRVFTAERIVDAFRTMQQARHIGKIVVSLAGAQPAVEQSVPSLAPVKFAKNSTWLVTGGCAGFGLESARWLAERGVGHLVLVGRRGMDTPGIRGVIDAFAEQGTKVFVHACDVTNNSAVTTLIQEMDKILPPLTGVLHAAAVFDDQLLDQLGTQGIKSVVQPKLQGAWNLHRATQAIPLKYFVLYSSITTTIGNPGQANYVAANTGLEGLAAMRQQMGLPATCIAWGPIGDAGYLTRNEAIKNSLEQRLGKPPLTTAEALQQLDRALRDNTSLVIPANFNWNTLAHLLPSATSSRFTILNRLYKNATQTGDAIDIQTLIADKTPEEVTDIVRDLVTQEVAQILCINPDRIEVNRSLHDLGMDSLMAVELALGLEQRFGIQLPVMMLNDAPNVNNVTARIAEKLMEGSAGVIEEVSSSAHKVAEFVQQHGEELTSDEINALDEEVYKLSRTGTKMIV